MLKTMAPLIIFLGLSIFLWKGLSRDPHQMVSPLLNKPLPAFNAENLLNPNDKVSSEDFKGHVSLINVFATWCVSCQVEHPILVDINNAHQIKIYGLNYKDDRAKVVAWLQERGNPYTKVIFDPTGEVGINWGVYGTPETFVIDAHGIVRDKIVGAISPESWRNDVLPEIKKLEQEAA